MLCLRAKFILIQAIVFFRNCYMNSVFKIAFSIEITTATLGVLKSERNFNDFIPLWFYDQCQRDGSRQFLGGTTNSIGNSIIRINN